MQPSQTTHQRYAPLDGVRGLAILLVFLSHLSYRRAWPFDGTGEFGVWLFFVLSAFLLALPFFQREERVLDWQEWANYALRRFLRIYPLYCFAAVLSFLWFRWDLAGLPTVLAIQEPFLWAVFVEVRFYLILPAIVPITVLLGRVHKVLPLAAVAAYLALHVGYFAGAELKPGYDIPNPLLFESMIPIFLFGVAAAWAFVHYRSTSALLAPIAIACFAVPFLAAAPIANELLRVDWRPDHYHLDWLPWSIIFAIGIYCAMQSQVGAWFARLRWLGYVSYSMYLFQDFWIETATKKPQGLPLTIAGVALTAWLFFIAIERPLSRITLWRVFPQLRSPARPRPLPAAQQS